MAAAVGAPMFDRAVFTACVLSPIDSSVELVVLGAEGANAWAALSVEINANIFILNKAGLVKYEGGPEWMVCC